MNYALRTDYDNRKLITSAKDIAMLNLDDIKGRFGAGVRVNLKISLKLDFKYYKTKIIPDYFDIGRFIIVSERLKSYLEKNNVNGQFVVVDLNKNGNKSEDDNYYLFNLLDKVDCFDLKNSKYTENSISGYFRSIDKLIFLKDKKYPNAFIVDKYFVPSYFVTKNFKEALEEEKFSGMSFVKLEDFTF